MPPAYFNTINEMRNSTTLAGEVVIVSGYRTINDGGGGYFKCVDTTTIPIEWQPMGDNGLIFRHFTDNDIWFRRIVDCPYISVKWFGAYGDDINDDSPYINAAMIACLNHNDICDSGNTKIELPASPGLSPVTTRTRIYFPSGIYRISEPIAYENVDGSYSPLYVDSLEIVGEQAGLVPAPAFNLSNFAMLLDPQNSLKITGMTFAGFNDGLGLTGNYDVTVVMDNMGFTGINRRALTVNCPNANILVNASKWYNCQYLLHQISGYVNIVGAWMTAKSYDIQNDDGSILLDSGKLNMENIMGVIHFGIYGETCAFIRNNGGSVRCENVRIGGEAPAGYTLLNYAKGQVYEVKPGSSKPIAPITIEFVECMLTAYWGVKLVEFPNFLSFENCFYLHNGNPIITYGGVEPIQQKLDEMYAHFSIKLDNFPYFLGEHIGGGLQANLVTDRHFELLPYMSINSGLDSYGYAESKDALPVPLKFFMGKLSYDGTIFSGIYGDYSFEVHLSNVSNFPIMQYHDSDKVRGVIYQYSAWRVEVKIDRTTPSMPKTMVADIKNITPTVNIDPDAPVIYTDANNPNLILVNVKQNIDSTTNRHGYSVFYEIRNLISPLVVPFGGIN